MPRTLPPGSAPAPPRILAVNRRDFTLRSVAALAAGSLAACSRESAQAAPAAPVPAQQAYDLVQQGRGFTVGPVMAAQTAYVFFDTSCPHCAHLWQAAQPLARRLKWVWLPVGLLRPQSLTQGAAILGAADPAAAMAENEKRLLARQGGLAVDTPPAEALLAQVKANTALFDRLGGESVPLMLYRHARSGNYGSHVGAASTEELAALLGL